jgi:hypothetical protein
MNMVTLQQAGYPMTADDLGREEWFDLAQVKGVLEPRFQCPLMAGKK